MRVKQQPGPDTPKTKCRTHKETSARETDRERKDRNIPQTHKPENNQG